MLRDGGRKPVEFALQVERRLARRRAAQPFVELVARAHRAAEFGQRRVRLDRDAAPAREIEGERDVVVDRMPGADVDVEAVLDFAERAPEMEVLEALRVGQGREGHATYLSSP